jgi:hypothetical protein
MLRVMREASLEVVPGRPAAPPLPGTREGDLGDLLRGRGLADVEESVISASADYDGFDDWWEPFLYGIGPHSGHLASLAEEQRAAIREACRARLGNPTGPFTLPALAWFARGRVD